MTPTHPYFVSLLHFLNSDTTALTPAWGEVKSIEMTYQKAKARVINTSLAGWIAEGDKPKVSRWIQIDVQ